jgi:predicted ABC-type exoprotein transport system permease subunit
MTNIPKTAGTNALATALYIILIASGLYYSENMELKEPNVLIPIFMLMLLVFSASLTGALMLGKPILWYLEGKKKEAVTLLGYTLGIFFVLMLLAFAALLFFSRH